MKTLVVSCVSLTCGGAERVISILSSRFASHFDSVKIVMWKDAPVFYKIDDRVEIISVENEISSRNYFKKILWFRSFLKKENPSLVLSFLAKSSVGVLLANVGVNAKVVVAERNDPRFLKGGKLMILIRDVLYTFADGILEQTESSRLYFSGQKLAKTKVIYNPVFMDSVYVGCACKEKREKVIVSVGRLEPQKNYKLLLDAFSEFHKLHPSYKLVIYGEGNCRTALEKQISDLCMSPCVDLPGNKTNVFDCVKNASAFVMTSNFEGMPNALIEAMCLGLPCISTKVSGAVDLIKNGENGLLVDVGNQPALVEALKKIVADEALAGSLGKEAAKIYNDLSVEKISKEWIDYLDSFVKT